MTKHDLHPQYGVVMVNRQQKLTNQTLI